MLASQDLWVIESSGQIVALMAFDAPELAAPSIEQIYVDPAWTGKGLGSRLIECAKKQHASLDLWTFQTNIGARRFYERHGFVAVQNTQGDNEEGAPDVRYHWAAPLRS